MSKLRRLIDDRTTYFISIVTYRRNDILIKNRDLFWRSMNNIIKKHDIDLIAWIVLPDHIHLVADFKEYAMSNIMQRMKMSFASGFRKRAKMTSGRVWQHRFWDHIIRDEKDLNCHLDYIHYNPVKHGFVNSPFDWKEPSIHDFLKRGLYSKDWGSRETICFDGEYGE